NRQLAAMRRILAGGAQAFVSFVETARERLESARARIEELDLTVSVEVVDQVFRVVHTIRGEARAFDVRELEHGAEALEELLEELGANARAGHHALDANLKADLITRLSGLLADLERGVAMFV